MDIEKEVYHSNGMLGLIPVVDESEAMSFHFGKLLNSDSKDFFNCDTSIGLEYPVRSALQPICVHVDGAESTNWVNPPCGENVDLLDISSKRLPVDLGLNGLDKSSIYSNGSTYSLTNMTPNNHVIVNSLPPASDLTSPETTDCYSNNNNSQYNEIYSTCMRADYGNHTPFVDNEKIYYNGNQSLYSNGYHSQHYDHLNHHVNHVNHLTPHQIYHNHHHHHHQQPTTPLHHYQPQKRGQQPFQRHFTHRRRLNLYDKSSPSPTKHRQKQQTQQQQQPQSPVQAQKQPKPTKPLKPPKSSVIQRSQKSPKPQQRQKPQPESPSSPPPAPKPQQQILFKRKKERIHDKKLEVKPELNQRAVLKRKLGRPRKYDYTPPKPTKFRSSRLRLKVQSEQEANSDDIQESGDTLGSEREVQSKEKEKKVKEVLPCDWIRPDNLTFDRKIVSDYEKTSLPEFFAGKFDRTHFHPSQYLQIRNIFLDEWESRKPNGVHFREMIRIHKGIGNVVSFSRVCKFLTAIGAINEIIQEDGDDNDENGDDDEDEESSSNNNSANDVTERTINKEEDPSEKRDENQSKNNQDEESDDAKDTNKPTVSSSSSSCTPNEETNGQTSSPPSASIQSEDNSTKEPETCRPRRKGRKRKSYFLNEMTRLGIDPLSAGFPIPGYDKDEESEQTTSIIDNNDDDHNQSENHVSPESVQN